jgi:hypothetical protein
LNWQNLALNPWVVGIGGSLVAAFIWMVWKRLLGSRKKRNSGVTVQQTASPVMTQNFQPTINIHPPSAPPTKGAFRAVQEQNTFSKEEAEERRLTQLEHSLHQLIVAVKLIHVDSEVRCAEKIAYTVADICGFFRNFPELRHLNVELLREFCSDDFPKEVRQAAINVWAETARSWRKADTETRASIEPPCDLLVKGIVGQLLLLRVRPNRTMKEFEDSLPN